MVPQSHTDAADQNREGGREGEGAEREGGKEWWGIWRILSQRQERNRV